MEWKVGRRKGKGVCVRDKKNKLSAGLDHANHLTIVTVGQCVRREEEGIYRMHV